MVALTENKVWAPKTCSSSSPKILSQPFMTKNFLSPIDVANIILTLLKIRGNTFKNGPQRYQEDYIKYDKKENPTQFYPNHEFKTYPKKVDEDFC